MFCPGHSVGSHGGAGQASHSPADPPFLGAWDAALRPVGAAPHSNWQTALQELVKLFTQVFIEISIFCCEKACFGFLEHFKLYLSTE